VHAQQPIIELFARFFATFGRVKTPFNRTLTYAVTDCRYKPVTIFVSVRRSLLPLIFIHIPITSKVSRVDFDVIMCLFSEVMQIG